MSAPLIAIAELLHRHGVDYLVIGGQAAILFGSPLPTYDIDICYRRTPENLRRLAAALAEIHPTLRGAPPDLPYKIDEVSLALGNNFTFNTDHGSFDLLGWVEPFGPFESLEVRAESFEFEGFSIRSISLEDLITIKRHIQRPKDQAVLFQLEAIQRIRSEKKT